jgi:RHS repeat-associated protein
MGGELGALVNYYSLPYAHCGTGSDNNGNLLLGVTIINSVQFEDQYSYDSLNRLTAVNEYLNGNTFSGKQEYDYDRWGNRTLKPGASLGTYKEFTVNTANNRLGVPASQPGTMAYDAAGNLTNDTYTGTGNRTYDGENKITSAWGGNNQAQLYGYDASGQRVKRTVDGVTTWQVYGFGGELLAEYPANGAATSPQKEYGYRNGELLITAVASSGGSTSSGLKGYWKFDENSGTTATDSSGNSNTGTLSSGAAWTTGQSGTATNLDGVDDYVQVGAQSSLVMTNACTLSAWIYPTGAGSLGAYGGIIVNKEGEYELARFADGTIQWAFANTNPGWNWINTGYVAPLNQWTHVAVTYDSGTVKTYINGTLTHTYSGSGTIGDVEPSLNDFRIGGRQVASHHFQGRIDEVRVYNRALSASEVPTLQSGAGTSSSSAQINWLVSDHLGTPRMIIDQTGTYANVKRHDYLPFGEELFAPVGGRDTVPGYVAGDGVRQQFTSYERDIETALDYARARYFSSVQGRFVSPDPLPASAKAWIPQSWNRYSYVLNHPLELIDPSGMIWVYHYLDEKHTRIGIAWIDGNKISKELKAKGYQALDFGGEKTKDIVLTDGRVARLDADSGRPKFLSGAQESSQGAYVNTGLVRELGRQTAPIPKATALFIAASLAGGYNIAMVGTPMVLGDATVYTLAYAKNFAEDSGSLPDTLVVGGTRAVEYQAGQTTPNGFLESAMKYLGPGYKEVSPGRFVSADGMRQVRFGAHETRGSNLHGHFEAYDMPGGRVVENSVVKIR